jgi:hypothetical protein
MARITVRIHMRGSPFDPSMWYIAVPYHGVMQIGQSYSGLASLDHPAPSSTGSTALGMKSNIASSHMVAHTACTSSAIMRADSISSPMLALLGP